MRRTDKEKRNRNIMVREKQKERDYGIERQR
jgi:hypothetical protein